MTQGIIAVEEEASVGRVAALMDDHHVKRIPVTREGRLIGIVSRVDLLRLIATAEPDDCAPGDTAIRRSILGAKPRSTTWSSSPLSSLTEWCIYGATSAQRTSERWRASFRKA
ncbi:MAG: CBS domain-containing protein [Mesorhizobium sp.]